MTEPVQISWHKTTTGKVVLIALTLAAISGAVYLYVRSKANKKEEEVIAPVVGKEVKLPFDGVGCGPVVSNFDHLFDYVKCGEEWFLISKDKNKIADWTPINKDSPINGLLNSKYGKI